MKREIQSYLEERGYEVINVGTDSIERLVPWGRSLDADKMRLRNC